MKPRAVMSDAGLGFARQRVPKAYDSNAIVPLPGRPLQTRGMLMDTTPDRPGRAVTFWNLPGDADMLDRIAESSARWGIRYRFKPIAPTDALLSDRARENRRRMETLARLGSLGLKVTTGEAA